MTLKNKRLMILALFDPQGAARWIETHCAVPIYDGCTIKLDM